MTKRYYSPGKLLCLLLLMHCLITVPNVFAEEDHEIIQSGILVVEDDDGTEIDYESKFPEHKTFEQSKSVPKPEKDAEGKINLNISFKAVYSDISGNIDQNGSKISLESDAGFSQKVRFAGQGQVSLNNNLKFLLEYLKIDESSSTNKNLTFDNSNYSSNSSIDLTTDLYDIGIAAKISPEQQNASITFHLLGGAKLKRLDLKLEEKNSKLNQASNMDQNYTLPYLGFMGDIKLSDAFTFHSSVKYLALNKKGTSTRLSDLKGLIIHNFNSTDLEDRMQWNIAFGYRYLLVQSKANDNSSELFLSGPTFGIEASF